MRATGFSVVTKALIRERATVEYGDFEIVACEVQQQCNGALASAIHHRRPRQRGGSRRPDTNMPANSLATCNACHNFIETAERALAYDNGWLVHQTDSPRDLPVLRRGEWCTLDDLGGVNPVERQAVI